MTLATLGQLLEERTHGEDAYVEDVWETACGDVDSNNLDWARIHGCSIYRTAVVERLSQLAYTEADVTACSPDHPNWAGDEF